MNNLPLYYWSDVPNFGDQLSCAVVEWATNRTVEQATAEQSGKLLAVGSILDKAKAGDFVWGSGVHPAHYHKYFKRHGRLAQFRDRVEVPAIQVLAVRGPITRDVLLANQVACPEVYGDPGLLLPLFFQPSLEKKHKVGIVPHYNDAHKYLNTSCQLIDVKQDWKKVVEEIVSCEKIISTSLHGIIIAEAYGIPAVWLRETDSEGMIKYLDYYLGTGRSIKACYDLEEALALNLKCELQFDHVPLLNSIRNSSLAKI